MRQRSLILIFSGLALFAVGLFAATRGYFSSRVILKIDQPRSAPARTRESPIALYSYSRPLLVKGLSLEDLTFNPESVVRYEGEQVVRISDDEVVRANIEVTTHGNGVLTLTQGGRPTLTIPIYDTCVEDDQFYVFDGEMLKYEFTGMDDDGILEMRVTGTLIFRNDQSVLHEWPIEDTYKYIRSERKWSLRHSNGPAQWVERLREQMAMPVALPS